MSPILSVTVNGDGRRPSLYTSRDSIASTRSSLCEYHYSRIENTFISKIAIEILHTAGPLRVTPRTKSCDTSIREEEVDERAIVKEGEKKFIDFVERTTKWYTD